MPPKGWKKEPSAAREFVDGVAGKGVDTLPPPGDERRDVLRQREDILQEQAEVLTDQMEVGAVDPAKIDPEEHREIMEEMDELHVTEADWARYHYKWENCAPSWHGLFVNRSRARGWEVVSGPMKEAEELRQADGTRRLADVLLMRIPRARHEALEAKDRAHRARTEGVEFDEITERGARQGMIVTPIGNMSPDAQRRMFGKAVAQETAGRMADSALRTGTMPGVR